MRWFGDDIFRDLQSAPGGSVHPALQVDAIRGLYTFPYYALFLRRALVICAFISRDSSRRNNWSRYFSCHRIASSRKKSWRTVRCGSARSKLVYAYRRFDDAHVRLALPPIASPSSSNFVGSHPRTCNSTVCAPAPRCPTCQNQCPEQPGAHGERLSHALCVLCVCVSRHAYCV